MATELDPMNKKRLLELLEPMKIPSLRRDITKKGNLYWLSRNLRAVNPMMNTDHSIDNVDRALVYIRLLVPKTDW